MQAMVVHGVDVADVLKAAGQIAKVCQGLIDLLSQIGICGNESDME